MHLHDVADLDLKPIHNLFTLYTHRYTTCLYSRCLSLTECQKIEVVQSTHSCLSLTLYKTPPLSSTTDVDKQLLCNSSLVMRGKLDWMVIWDLGKCWSCRHLERIFPAWYTHKFRKWQLVFDTLLWVMFIPEHCFFQPIVAKHLYITPQQGQRNGVNM
jgi:hypothetical protein